MNQRDELLNRWIKDRLDSNDFRDELISKKELRQQSRQMLEMIEGSVRASGGTDLEDQAYDELRAFLNDISHMRAVKGYTSLENATYILSLRNAVLPSLAGQLRA